MALSAPATLSEASREKSFTKLVVAVSIGNALEWYDISSYGYFAVYVSKAFFPNSDPTISLLLTFGYVRIGVLHSPRRRRRAWRLCRPPWPQGLVDGLHRPDDDRHAGARLHADLRDHRHPGADRGSCGPPGAGIFRRRRIRQLDRVSGGACAGPARVHRKLAICQPGDGPGAVVCVRRRAHNLDDVRGDAAPGVGAFRSCSASWSGRSASTSATISRTRPRRLRPSTNPWWARFFESKSFASCSPSARSRYRPRSTTSSFICRPMWSKRSTCRHQSDMSRRLPPPSPSRS